MAMRRKVKSLKGSKSHLGKTPSKEPSTRQRPKNYVPEALLKCPQGRKMDVWIARNLHGFKVSCKEKMYPKYENGLPVSWYSYRERGNLTSSLLLIKKLELQNYFLTALWETTGNRPGFICQDSKWHAFMATPMQICQAIWLIRAHVRRARREEEEREGKTGVE